MLTSPVLERPTQWPLAPKALTSQLPASPLDLPDVETAQDASPFDSSDAAIASTDLPNPPRGNRQTPQSIGDRSEPRINSNDQNSLLILFDVPVEEAQTMKESTDEVTGMVTLQESQPMLDSPVHGEDGALNPSDLVQVPKDLPKGSEGGKENNRREATTPRGKDSDSKSQHDNLSRPALPATNSLLEFLDIPCMWIWAFFADTWLSPDPPEDGGRLALSA